MKNFQTAFLFFALMAAAPVSQNIAWGDQDPKPPASLLDFTKGDQVPKVAAHDWTLGPIGARGWCQAGGKRAEGDTSESRQILITKVSPNGPSANQLRPGDVIVGVNHTRFDSDARLAFARSIEPAESSNGRLDLEVFRDGDVETVTIVLPKLPAFADTAPFRCRKSELILRAGCQGIYRRGLGRPSLPSHLNALALLASGEPGYHKMLIAYAHDTVAKPLAPNSSLPCWSFSFTNLFLCEYYLASKDQTVLKEIQRLTEYLVRGQGPLGTWGHSFVDTSRDRLIGYGAVNAVGLPCAISLVLARECGVKVDGLDESISLSADFFRRHVNLGAIPYGDGPPNLQYGHDDNGKNSAAAILFSLLGDEQATNYYVRTALASYGIDREQGHTGNFFNMFWSLPAVSLAGPKATGAWLDEFGWYYDLARDHELRFPYQGYPKQRPGNAYSNWDCPGAYLLHFSTPLKKLRITGKNVKEPPSFTSAEIAETIAAGKVDYGNADRKVLEELLASWSPIVRNKSETELRRRKIAPTVPSRLTSRDPIERIAALRASSNFAACSRLLEDRDVTVRIAAFEALARINRQAAWLAAVQHLAKHENEEPVFTQAIGSMFFPISIRPAAAGKLLAAPSDRRAAGIAIKRLLNDEDCLVSSRVAIGLPALPDNELVALLPLIYEKAKHGSIGNVMFSNKLRISCAEILTKLKLKEGAEVSAMLLADTSWGKVNRMPQAAKLLKSYAGHGKPYLEPLRQTAKGLTSSGDAKWRDLINDTIRSIEEAPEPSGTLRSLDSI
ncbi:hypothetical protein Q31b_46530 [Novipirellula aureliae]|uniref:PDZ domain-containing protein n=1 Tax=Novipirellula aureliae TaxID=2527966 RepID=A0A5C6DNT8_9BACT|nr:DUF6288 domain-containing protein [Novipirellula aureliae]TWU37864.1 hypothetical protein Q31b_46530 [Novipirellula aureliae]